MRKINNKLIYEQFMEYKNQKTNDITGLYKYTFELVQSIAFSILKNTEDANDVSQNVFTKIVEIDKKMLPSEYEASWLYTVTKNECISFLRKKNSYIDIGEIYEIKEKNSDIDKIIEAESFNRIIDGLEEKEKQIICLKIISKLNFREISKILNIPMGTVQWIYYKSIRSLRVSLTSLGAFILTFIFGIGILIRKNSSDNFRNSMTSKPSTNISEDHLKEYFNTGEIVDKIQGQSTITSDSIKGINGIENLKSETILFTFSGIFLLITIIFGIFYLKHQQKRKKKASK